MASEETQEFDDYPIITYSNRIQKHMFKLTEFMGAADLKKTPNRRIAANMMIMLIQNLPPTGQKVLSDIYDKCHLPTTEFTSSDLFEMYGVVSNWTYEKVLQDAFKIKPLSKATPHIGVKS